MKQGHNKRQLRPTLGAAHSRTFINIISLELLYIQAFFSQGTERNKTDIIHVEASIRMSFMNADMDTDTKTVMRIPKMSSYK